MVGTQVRLPVNGPSIPYSHHLRDISIFAPRNLRVRVVRARPNKVENHDVTASVSRRLSIEPEDVLVAWQRREWESGDIALQYEKLHRNAQGLRIPGTSEPF